jgi:mRNA interferase HigB
VAAGRREAVEWVNPTGQLTSFTRCIHSVCVRIIKESYLRDAAEAYPKAAKYLTVWMATVRAARWETLSDLRRVYPSADLVVVRSGKSVIVFNVCGNTYRLIVAVHFDRGMVYTLLFFTHAEYSKDKWKDEL